MSATVSPLRQPKSAEEPGFVIALHIGSFSIRLVFVRFGERVASKRRQSAEERAAAEAERQRWVEIDRLMAAQTIIDRAKGRAA